MAGALSGMGGGMGDGGGVQVQGREGSRSKGGRKEKGKRMGRRSEKRENQTRASEKECEEKKTVHCCPLSNCWVGATASICGSMSPMPGRPLRCRSH